MKALLHIVNSFLILLALNACGMSEEMQNPIDPYLTTQPENPIDERHDQTKQNESESNPIVVESKQTPIAKVDPGSQATPVVSTSTQTSTSTTPVKPVNVQSKTNQKLFEFYSVKANYQKVYDNLATWWVKTRSNACVAFMSTALRLIGIKIPTDQYLEGYNISLVTLPFSQYLQNNLKWKKITDHKLLLPGDVVLAEDDERYPGFPAHTYMFHSWTDQKNGIGYVIDNQDFTHERNIFGYGEYNFTPFAYALRAID